MAHCYICKFIFLSARIASLSTVINWGTSFVVTKFFDQIQDALGIWWCYWIFAIVCGVGFVFVFLLLPETKGKSVEEIENYFGVPREDSEEKKSKELQQKM